jgi:hypothetical protein
MTNIKGLIAFGQVEDMLDECRPNDIVCLSASVDDPPDGWSKHFCKILEMVPSMRPSVVVLTFHGYDHDPREIFEIPECREWARKLIEHDRNSIRALMDENVIRKRMGPMGEAIATGAYGRAKLLGLAGYHAEYIWKENKSEGYYLKLNETGSRILKAMLREDMLDLLIESRKSDGDPN